MAMLHFLISRCELIHTLLKFLFHGDVLLLHMFHCFKPIAPLLVDVVNIFLSVPNLLGIHVAGHPIQLLNLPAQGLFCAFVLCGFTSQAFNMSRELLMVALRSL